MDDSDAETLPKPRRAQARAIELVGRIVSQRYRVDELLAMGGMGAVYRGHHLLLKKRVAIKVLRPAADHAPELSARFEREAIAGAHVAHANVAAATDFGQLDDGSFFLVLEYVPGRTLHQIVKDGPIPAPRVLHIARQLAAGLGAVHAMGIVHRDVKPRNVMLVEKQNDLAKLIDFGLAKVSIDRIVAAQSARASIVSLSEVTRPRRAQVDSLVIPTHDGIDSKPRLTGVGVIVGTVAYLAPEAAFGMEAVDARADLYGLGLVLYQMLAGKHPFEAENDAALFTAQRFSAPPPIADRAPGVEVPPELEALVMRLLRKDPAARYQTGSEVIDALDAIDGSRVTQSERGSAVRTAAPIAIGFGGIVAGVAIALASRNPPQHEAPLRDPTPAERTVASAAAEPKPAVETTTIAEPAAPPPPPPAPPLAKPPPPPAAVPASVTVPATMVLAPTSAQRLLFLRALRVHDWNGAEAAFFELVEHEPEVLHGPVMVTAMRDLAVALEHEGKGEQVFDALVNKLGTDGLDVLYDLVATKGRARAALRASALLKRSDILARASSEMRIAFELREAPCIAKLGLLDRAATEGDARAFIVLETQGAACFRKNNKAVQQAMHALRTRLYSRR